MGNSKRLLILVTQSAWGGVQGYVARCAKEAQQRGFEVLVAAGKNQDVGTSGRRDVMASDQLLSSTPTSRLPDFPSALKNAGISYQPLQYLGRTVSFSEDAKAIQEMTRLMREWKPDTLYLHSSKAGVLGSIAGRMARVPRIVYRIGGWSFLDPVSPIQRRIRLWSERLTAPLKDVIITLHPGDEALARRYHITPRKQLAMIPNGMNLAEADAARLPREEARQELDALFGSGAPQTGAREEADARRAREEEAGARRAPLLLTIANFYPTKNLLGYLDALAIVHAQRPDVRAVILGDGEERIALEQKRRDLGLENIVALPGARADAAALLSGADLFVLPSLKEGMPWTLLEAMTAYVPVVATDVGANRWAAEGSAMIVPSNNPNALADAIVEMLRDPASMRINAVAGRRTVEERFTETEMWEKTFEIL